MVSRAVLMKSGLVSITTTRQNISKTTLSVNTARQVNTTHSKTTVNAGRPMSYLSKIAHSTVKRPINNNTSFKNSNINQKVNTVRGKNVNTARPKAVVNVVQGNNVNAVKASACWVWKPKTKVLDHGNPQMDLQDQEVIDSGCSRHMAGNMSYLTDYEEIDGGYVAFGGNPKGEKITGKCTIKTGNLEDEEKIIIFEASVRRDLKLEDEEGIDCLPNSTIFEQLALMGSKTTAWNEFSSTMASAIICLATNQKFNFSKFIFEGMIRNLDNVSRKFLMYPRKPRRKDTQVTRPSDHSENVTDKAVHKELCNSLVRAATTASSLEAEKGNGNITKTRSKENTYESSSLGTTSGGGPKCQKTMGDTIAQTMFENVSKLSNHSLLARGNTLRSDEDRLKLNELMKLCTTLQKKVLDLEKTKLTQANEIASLKRRVKKLEKKRSSRTHKLKRLYKVGLSARLESSSDEEDLGEDASKQGKRSNAIDADEDITLVNVQDDAGKELIDMDALNVEEVFVAGQNENIVEEVVDVAQVSTAATTITITTEEITLAQTLEALKTSQGERDCFSRAIYNNNNNNNFFTTITGQG
ncbi:hypothetical protein Tco_1183307 [Tanacetum coccineum]